MTKPAIDLATPQITEPMRTPEEMVATANDLIPEIKAGPSYGSSPDVQTAVANWQTANTNLDTNNTSKATAKSALALAETNEPPLLRRWAIRRNAVLVAIQAVGDGSKAVVQSFNVQVEQKKTKPLAIVPVNLRPMKERKPAYASVRWNPVPGAHGYLLQHATNPADPTTYSPPISISASRYYLAGQTAATTVYFRVLACDNRLPNGQTAYCAWVPVVVIG